MTTITVILPKVILLSPVNDKLKIYSIKYDQEWDVSLESYILAVIENDGFAIQEVPGGIYCNVLVGDEGKFERSKFYKRDVFLKFQRDAKLRELMLYV